MTMEQLEFGCNILFDVMLIVLPIMQICAIKMLVYLIKDTFR